MTSRERVAAAFRHEEPDRVPVFEQTVCVRIASEIMGRKMRTGGGLIRFEETAARWESEQAWQEYVEQIIADVGDLTRELDHDIAHIPWRHAARPSARLDEQTFRYEDPASATWSVYRYDPVSDVFHEVDSAVRQEGIPAIERIIASWGTDPPQPPAPSAYDALRRIAARAGGDRYLVSCDGMLMIPPHAAWLEACALRPDLVERYLDGALEYALVAIPVAAQAGVHCLWAGGDLASSAGPIYSPAMFRRYLLPRLQAVVRKAHECGLVYLFRTDGNVWSIAQELFVESGVDGYGEIDIDAGMRLPEIKRRLPHLTLWGGISCGSTLSLGTPADVREAVRRTLEACMPGGGLIFGSSNSIHNGIPTRNFLAMLEAVREFGVYRKQPGSRQAGATPVPKFPGPVILGG